MSKRQEDRMENIEPNEARELVHRVAKEWVREAELVPLSHLSLDLAEPLNGWERALLERGVEIVEDDLDRRCVPREVLGDLLREERERLARIEAENAARAAAAVAPVPVGVPPVEGASPFESLMASDRSYVSPSEEFGGRPKPRFLEEELEAGARQQLAARAETAARKAARDR